MKKKRLNKVLNIVVTLMAAIALMLGNVTSVAAYTALDGYAINYPIADLAFYNSDSVLPCKALISQFYSDTNSYLFEDETVNNRITNFKGLYFYSDYENFVFPYNDTLYDYYIVGTFISLVGADNSAYNFSPDYLNFYSYDNDRVRQRLPSYDGKFYDYSNGSYKGFSFSAKVDFSDYSTLCGIDVYSDSECEFITTKTSVSVSIVPVPKSGTEADTLNSILQTLTQINQNIITGNTLQQQTIDAINQNTTNTSNWFTSLISNLSTWYYQRKEDLSNWFLDIDNRLSSGFAALYSQMTKEQDEKLNSYDDTTQSDAADNFNTESDKLTQLEDQLNDQSHGFVSDFTDTGFDVGVLNTVSESLLFVTTWFTNFWNLGGIFTACLNLCFALSIVFYVLRFRK